MTDPACPDCGAETQYVGGMWRCPWASLARWGKGKKDGVTVVTCGWPLDDKRKIAGVPNGVIAHG